MRTLSRANERSAAHAPLDLTTFLWFGYSVPVVEARSSVVDLEALWRMAASRDSISPAHRISRGLRCLNQAIDNALAGLDGDVLVPLSGGLDSRCLLAGALERMEARRITTFTYGLPSSTDFKLSKLVAAQAGVRHVAFDLTQHTYDMESLIDISRRVGSRTSLFDYRPARWIERELGTDRVVISGFSGSADANPINSDQPSWSQVVGAFLRYYRFSTSIDLTPPNTDRSIGMPSNPPLAADRMPLDIQFNLFVRQEYGCRLSNLMDRFEYRTPLTDLAWFDFMLSAPPRLRFERRLYREILWRFSPRLFSLPCKSNYGLPLNAPYWRVLVNRISRRLRRELQAMAPALPLGPNRGVNYDDFDAALRERADIRDVVRASLADLKRRNVVDWLDLDEIWRQHERKHANHGAALTLLASLEINLKVLGREV
jgi:Asparagine synthase